MDKTEIIEIMQKSNSLLAAEVGAGLFTLGAMTYASARGMFLGLRRSEWAKGAFYLLWSAEVRRNFNVDRWATHVAEAVARLEESRGKTRETTKANVGSGLTPEEQAILDGIAERLDDNRHG